MSKSTTIADCKIIDLRKFKAPQGSITPIEGGDVPFEIKRVFYQYDVPGGESRGAHAHIKDQQFLIAISGSFEVMIDDGKNRDVITLKQPYYGIISSSRNMVSRARFFVWRCVLGVDGQCL